MTARIDAGIDRNDVKSLLAVSNADGQSIVVLWADPVTHALLVKLVGGGGGLTEIDFTGTVNGVNTTFTGSKPTYVVSDGVWLKATDSNNNTQWSWAANTLTMIVPPQSSIFGF